MRSNGESVDWLCTPLPPPNLISSAVLAIHALIALPIARTIAAVSSRVSSDTATDGSQSYELDT